MKTYKEKRIPSEISTDPFYSESNMNYLRTLVDDVECGKVKLVEHDLVEDPANISNSEQCDQNDESMTQLINELNTSAQSAEKEGWISEEELLTHLHSKKNENTEKSL